MSSIADRVIVASARSTCSRALRGRPRDSSASASVPLPKSRAKGRGAARVLDHGAGDRLRLLRLPGQLEEHPEHGLADVGQLRHRGGQRDRLACRRHRGGDAAVAVGRAQQLELDLVLDAPDRVLALPGDVGAAEQPADLERRPRRDLGRRRHRDRHVGPRVQHPVGKRLDPAQQRRRPPAADEHQMVLGQQISEQRVVARVAGELGGVFGHALVDEPGGGAPLHRPRRAGLELLEFGDQRPPQQRVVAEPAAPAALAAHQKAGLAQLVDQLLRADPLQHRVAERAVEAAEHRAAPQEGAQLRGQPVDHLVHQVVAQLAVGGGELQRRPTRVGSVAQPERRHVDGGGPAAGRLLDRVALVAGELQPEPVEQVGGLLVVEGQLLGPQPHQFAAAVEALERQRGLLAGQQDPAHLRRQQPHPELDRAQTGGVLDQVEVVEDEDERLPCLPRFGGKLFDRPARRADRAPQRPARLLADPVLAGRLGEDPGPEQDGVVVFLVEADPDHAGALPAEESLDRGRLAEARRGGDDEQRRGPIAVESAEHPRPPDQPVHPGDLAISPVDFRRHRLGSLYL